MVGGFLRVANKQESNSRNEETGTIGSTGSLQTQVETDKGNGMSKQKAKKV